MLKEASGRVLGRLNRCYSILPVPFEEDGRIDYFAYDRILEYQMVSGCGGLAFGFPRGGGQCLSFEEYRLLLQQTVLFASGKAPVLAFCRGANTEEALALAEAAFDAGADALFCPPPFGISCKSPGYFAHLQALSEKGLPFIAMREKGAGALMLSVEQSRIKGLFAFAQQGEGLLDSQLFLLELPEKALFCTGDDRMYSSLCLGFSGALSSCACLLPEAMNRLFRQGREGARKGASLQKNLCPVLCRLQEQEGPAPLIWGLHKKGLCAPFLRLPYTLPHRSRLTALERALEEFSRLERIP